jgi:hypothetical protein
MLMVSKSAYSLPAKGTVTCPNDRVRPVCGVVLLVEL